MPRPRVLDEGKKREICALVTAGMSLSNVARYVGCHRATIYKQRKHDAEFEQQMRRAGMRAVLSPLEAMRRAASTHWRAAAWLLERQERLEAKRHASAAKYSRDDLANLADQVLDLVRRATLCPLEGPRVEKKIEHLFVGLVPGGTGERKASRAVSGPTIAESICFLEQRWDERAAPGDDPGGESWKELAGKLGAEFLAGSEPQTESKSTPDNLFVDLRLLAERLASGEIEETTDKNAVSDRSADEE